MKPCAPAVSDGVLEVRRPADREDVDVGVDDADAPDQGDAAGDVGQAWVDDHDVGVLVAHERDGVGNLAGAADDGEAMTDAEDPDHALARAVVGVDDEHAGADGGR